MRFFHRWADDDPIEWHRRSILWADAGKMVAIFGKRLHSGDSKPSRSRVGRRHGNGYYYYAFLVEVWLYRFAWQKKYLGWTLLGPRTLKPNSSERKGVPPFLETLCKFHSDRNQRCFSCEGWLLLAVCLLQAAKQRIGFLGEPCSSKQTSRWGNKLVLNS